MYVIRTHREKITVTAVLTLLFTIVMFRWFSVRVREKLAENNKAILQLEEMRIKLKQNILHIDKSETKSREYDPKSAENNPNSRGIDLKKKSFDNIKLTDALHVTETMNNMKVVILTFGSREFSSSLDVLNENKNIVYWHEPMKIWERVDRNWRGDDIHVFEGDPLEKFNLPTLDKQYTYDSARMFYNELLSCKFSLKIIGFLKRALKVCPDYLKLTKFLGQLLNCDRKNRCNEPSKATVASINQLCKQRKYNVFVRESEERTLPLGFFYNNLTKAITSSLKVLHLVRDPRAVFLEFANQGRLPKNAFMQDLWTKGSFTCQKLVQNLKTGKLKIRTSSYFLFRYEDFMDDADITKKIFKLALNNSNNGQPMIARQSWWRAEISATFSSAAENICWVPIVELGYNYLDSNVKEGESFIRIKL